MKKLERIEGFTLDSLVSENTKEPSITALPVWWRGYRFRSRLEGRWACFFERLWISYEYEPQGFKLSNGMCYLPDFYLPDIRAWGEVKSHYLTPPDTQKCELTVKETGGLFLFLEGPPDFRPYTGASLDSGEITTAAYSLDIHFRPGLFASEHRLFSDPGVDELSEVNVSTEYRSAVYASRAERFDQPMMPDSGNEPFNPNPQDMGFAE